MSRNRDIANVLSKSTSIALDSEVGLVPVTPSSIAVTGGSGSISLNTVSFTSATAVSLNDVFSSTYTNYRLMINITAKSIAQPLNFRLRAAGSDHITTDYRGYYAGILGATETLAGYDAQNSAIFTDTNANGYINLEVDIFNPSLSSTGTTMVSTGVGASASDRRIYRSGYQMSSNSFDGFTLFVGGTITGAMSVYGYRK
jgi:hypothetical protein